MLALLALAFNLLTAPAQQPADPATYLSDVAAVLRTDWPRNRTVNVVCHGHSVPAGYFKTPEVRSLDSYPHLLRVGLAERYPHAVINVVVTAIGGENAESGAARFEADILALRPDVVAIDYALNDRRIGLERARAAWTKMISAAKIRGAKVILLTPTPDQSADFLNPEDPLGLHAEQVRALAREHGVGLVDSTAAFQKAMREGIRLPDLMSQVNHPNRKGHELVATELLKWFPVR
jgi:lysophospholipase L1-like esterase